MSLRTYFEEQVKDATALYNENINTDCSNDLKEYYKGKVAAFINMKHELEKRVICPRCEDSFNIVVCGFCSGEGYVEKDKREAYLKLSVQEQDMAVSMKLDDLNKFNIPKEKDETHESVNHPPHYISGGIEVIDILKTKLTKDQFEGYLLGNIIKYTMRANHKNSFTEDLKKAQWYLNFLLKFCKENI